MEKCQFAEKVAIFIAEHIKMHKNARLLVTVSGGADSVALLLVLRHLGYECVVAHCNFHLRGEESNRDEQFVRDLAERLNLPLHVVHFDVAAYETSHRVSTEMACRELRYAWFEKLMAEERCEAIAVAHHRDDAVETFFLNAMRGSGVQGLASIKPVNGNVVRPLLGVSRKDVEDYLVAMGETFIVDSTNRENEFKRNKLRNVILPLIYDQFPEAEVGFVHTIDNMRSSASLFAELVDQAKQKIVSTNGVVAKIDKAELLKLNCSSAMLFELLKPYGFNSVQVAEVENAIGQSGKRFLSADYQLVVERDHLSIVKNAVATDERVAVRLDHNIQHPVRVKVSLVDEAFVPGVADGSSVVVFNKDVINAKNICLRHWKTGDRFKPFGLKGSKLLSDLFADMKLAEHEKRNAWLLEVDGEIAWVLGYRSADMFRVKKSDVGYLKLEYIKEED